LLFFILLLLSVIFPARGCWSENKTNNGGTPFFNDFMVPFDVSCLSVFPSFREIATPRGLAHRARLGVRNDTHFVECFSGLGDLVCERKPLTAPQVQASDRMPDDESAVAGGINNSDVWMRFLTRWWVFDYTFINSI
jgi:hypothetical protein